MKHLKVVVFIVLITGFLSGFAQEQSNGKRYKLAVGYSLGSTIGTGFSVRYNISKTLGIQASTKLPQVGGDEVLLKTRVGFSIYYYLLHGNTSALFIYSGGKYFYSKTKYIYYEDYPTYSTTYKINEEANYGLGLGIGMELYVRPNIAFSLMGGYGFYSNSQGPGLAGETSILFYIK